MWSRCTGAHLIPKNSSARRASITVGPHVLTRTYTALVLSVLIGIGNAGFAHAAIPEPERQALIDLYRATHGDDWKRNDGWLVDDKNDFSVAGTECDWYGISCDSDDSHVESIDLHDNALTGSIP